MLEELIIEQCSPTLAGLKTGNLFSVSVGDETSMICEIRELNRCLKEKGLRIVYLRKTAGTALIYMYRPDYLKRDFNDQIARDLLEERGYRYSRPESCVKRLVARLKEGAGFPHEIGLFLGYPPSDVVCFMKSPCEGVQCCGCWKAYSNPESAQETFRKYKKCTDIYRVMNRRGKSLNQLAVAVNVMPAA